MKELKKENRVEIPQTQSCGNQQPSVSSNDTTNLKIFDEYQTQCKEAIDKLGVVLEYLVGLLDKDKEGIVEYVKNFFQDDVFLLTYVADASKLLRELHYFIEEEHRNRK